MEDSFIENADFNVDVLLKRVLRFILLLNSRIILLATGTENLMEYSFVVLQVSKVQFSCISMISSQVCFLFVLYIKQSSKDVFSFSFPLEGRKKDVSCHEDIITSLTMHF